LISDFSDSSADVPAFWSDGENFITEQDSIELAFAPPGAGKAAYNDALKQAEMPSPEYSEEERIFDLGFSYFIGGAKGVEVGAPIIIQELIWIPIPGDEAVRVAVHGGKWFYRLLGIRIGKHIVVTTGKGVVKELTVKESLKVAKEYAIKGLIKNPKDLKGAARLLENEYKKIITAGIPNRPPAVNRRLQDVFEQLWRDSDRIPGGTAGALRYELPRGISTHVKKARERIRNLERIIKEENLIMKDRETARRVIEDLRKSLIGE